jgi:hypothetical protein
MVMKRKLLQLKTAYQWFKATSKPIKKDSKSALTPTSNKSKSSSRLKGAVTGSASKRR